MTKPIIAVDIDDVLAKGTESLRIEVNEKLGINLQPEHYAVPGDYWGYYEMVWQSNGIGNQVTLDEFSSKMIADQSHVPAYDDALPVLQDLKHRFDLVTVTARAISWEQATKEWLTQHFPNIFSGVYFAGHYKAGPQTKGELCKELKATWLIDDNIEHAHSAVEQGIKVILFGEYGWHIDQQINKSIVQCKDWRAVQEYFSGQPA